MLNYFVMVYFFNLDRKQMQWLSHFTNELNITDRSDLFLLPS